jgi:hypothetical protein
MANTSEPQAAVAPIARWHSLSYGACKLTVGVHVMAEGDAPLRSRILARAITEAEGEANEALRQVERELDREHAKGGR